MECKLLACPHGHLLERMSHYTVDSAKVSLQAFDFLAREHLNEQNAPTGRETHNWVEGGSVGGYCKLYTGVSVVVDQLTVVYL